MRAASSSSPSRVGQVLAVELLDAGRACPLLRRRLICRRGCRCRIGCSPGRIVDALIRRRQIAAAPGRRAALHAAAGIGQHDERRQVVVLGAQAIGDPAADARLAHQDAAGVHLIHRLRMVHAVAVQLRITHRSSASSAICGRKSLTSRPDWPRGRSGLTGGQERILGHLAAGHHHAEALGQRLAGELDQIGLGIEQIDMARPAMHEEPDHALDPRRDQGDFEPLFAFDDSPPRESSASSKAGAASDRTRRRQWFQPAGDSGLATIMAERHADSARSS